MNTRRRRSSAALLALCVLTIICGGVRSSIAGLYTNAEDRLSIQFPDGWYLKSSSVDGVLMKSRRRSDLLAFMSISAYQLEQGFTVANVSAKELLDFSLAYNDNVDALLIDSGAMTIGNTRAPWIKYEVRSPAFASGYVFDCYIVRGNTLFKVGGSTDRDLGWFKQNEPLFIQACRSVRFLSADDGVTDRAPLAQHTDHLHGFRLNYPSDWTVKEAMTEATVFKAVKKFADGQYLMFTVNAQLLDRSDYSMTDFTIEDITGFARKMYGADNVTVLNSGRAQVSGVPCIKLLLDARPPIIQPRVEYSTYVIRNRYLYTVTISCNKPLYQQYAQLLKQLGDSFVFIALPSAATSGSTRQQTYDTGNYRLVVTEPGEKPLPAFLKAFGETWLKYVIIAILFAAGFAIWAKIKSKRSTESPNKSVDSDKK